VTQTGINKIDVSKITTTAQTRCVQEHASGLRRYVAEQYVSFAAAAGVTTGIIVPANSVIVMTALKSDTALALTTATSLSVGDASDPDELFETAEATLDAQNDTVVDMPAGGDAIAADTTIKLATTNGSGAAAGTGTWAGVVRVVYDHFDGLTDF